MDKMGYSIHLRTIAPSVEGKFNISSEKERGGVKKFVYTTKYKSIEIYKHELEETIGTFIDSILLPCTSSCRLPALIT